MTETLEYLVGKIVAGENLYEISYSPQNARAVKYTIKEVSSPEFQTSRSADLWCTLSTEEKDCHRIVQERLGCKITIIHPRLENQVSPGWVSIPKNLSRQSQRVVRLFFFSKEEADRELRRLADAILQKAQKNVDLATKRLLALRNERGSCESKIQTTRKAKPDGVRPSNAPPLWGVFGIDGWHRCVGCTPEIVVGSVINIH